MQNQSYTHWEHLIQDGGSTDNTVAIVQRYPHLKWESGSDLGQSDALNRAYRRSTGDLIVCLNADDTFEPGVFAQVVRYFTAHPTSRFVTGPLQLVYSKQTITHLPATTLPEILVLAPYNFPQNPVSYFYYREVQERVGLWPVDNHLSMDYWFLLRAYQQYPIHLLPDVMGQFYIHGTNKSKDGVACQQSQFAVRKQFLQQIVTDRLQGMPPETEQPLAYLLEGLGKASVEREAAALLNAHRQKIKQQKNLLAQFQQPWFLFRHLVNVLLTKLFG